MTVFGWDASHYDGPLTAAILARAKSEGIAFFTHKLGEGLGGEDPTQATALAAARDAGILVLGGYWFLHGDNDPVAEASACIAMADAHVPWWRTFDGWVWQADSETSSTGLPSPAHVKKFADSLASRTGRTVLVYASKGMYGDRLAGLGHPLWNASYGDNPKGVFKSVYPGDYSSGWGPYSGQTPVILQFGSNATVAGLSTCDVNAFQGEIDDLLDLIGADMAAPTAEEVARAVLAEVIDQPGVKSTVGNLIAVTYLNSLAAKTALTPDRLAAALKAALPPSVAAAVNVEQTAAAMHEHLTATQV